MVETAGPFGPEAWSFLQVAQNYQSIYWEEKRTVPIFINILFANVYIELEKSVNIHNIYTHVTV